MTGEPRSNSVSLVLLPGLAADADVFAPQRLAFPDMIIPQWPQPQADESLAAYAERFACSITVPQPFVLGGASFGGVVAQQMAPFLRPRAIILIGSVRGPSQLPRRITLWRAIRGLAPWLPIPALQWVSRALTGRLGCWLLPHLSRVTAQFVRADPHLVRWSVRELLSWRREPQAVCPVFQIHGSRDWVMPPSLTAPDEIIPGGGHVISLSHPDEVTSFIQRQLGRALDGDLDESLSRP